ncbi:MAG: HAMP domain-containing histidine kinase [Clostridia bacterium]|nr:HAMP domain-containing histidine kinase [Clostridia bacterium]
MFGKTKVKIVFTVVLSLLALMIVTLSTIYLSSRAAMRNENDEMLMTYIGLYDPENQREDFDKEDPPPLEHDNLFSEFPGMMQGKGHMRNEPGFRLSTFYSVAYSESGEIISINNGNNGLQSENTLLEIASAALERKKETGTYGSIYYRIADKDGYTLVAMIDGTIGDKNLELLFKQMLMIGAAAVAVLLAISVIVARIIVRPLEENDIRQKRFVSDAGHELKTPVAVISANSELLRREIGDSEWLDNIDYENSRMSDLIKQLLMLSKAENEKIPKETLDFSKLVNGEALPFESLAFEKGKTIISETENGIFVEGSQNQLRQLISVLLDNALSHGTGTVIYLSLKSERHFACLSVANESDPLDDEQLAHIFDRFYRTDEARKGEDSHYGLGLSIAHAVASAHGGQIRADYKNGKAVFTVLIPKK